MLHNTPGSVFIPYIKAMEDVKPAKAIELKNFLERFMVKMTEAETKSLTSWQIL